MKRNNLFAAATGMNGSNATPTKSESSGQFKDPGYNPGEFEMDEYNQRNTGKCKNKHSESQIGKLKDELYNHTDE